ncbi:MAG: bifunctional 3'-5' exonuclease/DNA polymerase, partial [Rothia sp. (in: high G+C Gram-positive bacteria)]|nr:bifunctional 3'-5' exonuclease/DNA polymerase [Rothia sp. (in: high G+C Gram-positive bacteria)]
MYIVLGPADSAPAEPGAAQLWEAITVTDSGGGTHRTFAQHKLAAFVQAVERQNTHRTIRWVWGDTRQVAPLLLAQGVSPASCHDLRLVQRVLSTVASRVQNRTGYQPTLAVDVAPQPAGHLPTRREIEGQEALFDEPATTSAQEQASARPTASALLRELQAQLTALRAAPHPARLHLLAAAESQGGLIAAEMKHYGMPWNRTIHEKILEHELGPRPAGYDRPYKMEQLAARLREELKAPRLNPDSPQEVLKALQAAGFTVNSTRKWELIEWANSVPHLRETRWQVVRPLLEYKRLARLYTANGWA